MRLWSTARGGDKGPGGSPAAVGDTVVVTGRNQAPTSMDAPSTAIAAKRKTPVQPRGAHLHLTVQHPEHSWTGALGKEERGAVLRAKSAGKQKPSQKR